METSIIEKLTQENYNELVRLRRHFHMYPELSFQEVQTPAYIAEYLRELGLEVQEGIGGRGVVGRLRVDDALPTVALRADFDALPIQDAKDVPYKSTVPGVMHACGHDAHTAVVLTTARILAQHKEDLSGNVVFIFQHAEEVDPGGAIQMIADGCLDGVDAIFGQHVTSSLDVGTIGYKYGIATGMPDDFTVKIHGRGAHASKPHVAIDPVAAAISFCNQLQYVVTRKSKPMEPVVLSITMFNGGHQHNVIPDVVTVGGTIRTFTPEAQNLMITELKKCLEGLVTTTGISYDLDYMKGYPPVVNDKDITDIILESAKEISTVKETEELEPDLGGEDFSYYLQRVPGTFYYTGTRNPNFKADYPHHHAKFDIDEKGLVNAVSVMLKSVFKFFEKETKQ
ncbi:amidohydrolase [Salinicoccus halodurans]|uniref:Amidohydrolase n=1 Tax=Salinicoccus halodurans TaxID=407035 RepID=A0A0F7HLY6_9STAP|nr:amidohydrolase [Salinicoccus halodurans]AKG75077.1 peptidase M20 [Salinicoccus halodurans]SFK65444.1 amidohydrolase [Salinicoccus halodurans]